MKQNIRRTLSLLLCLVLMFQLAEPTLAVWQEDAPTAAQAESPVVLRDAQGNEAEADESWEEVYPYGAFGFDVTAADAKEGEDTVVTLYRVGGTTGKATAYITYQPLLVANEDESVYYGYALSGKDLTLEVEDPLPIADYQPVGKPADPEPCDDVIGKSADDEGYVLTLDRDAEHYQWEILYEGIWCAIGESDKNTLAMDAGFLEDGYDYRCIYTVDGARYCTDSFKGEAYEKPAPVELADVPADIELSPDPAYSAIALDDEEDPYSGWIFGVTFAEGEWKKEIHIHANTDEICEGEEGATMRIAYTDGGEIYSGADTLLYHVADINESTPSKVGFSVGTVQVDKSEGVVEIPVRRDGGTERPVSVEYRTVDGTAKAGKDYVAASGTLMLYGNITELDVKVELIDTEEISEDTLDFSVELFELKGDDNCTLTDAEATVSLTDAIEDQTAGNLATLLFDEDAVDVTESVQESPTAASSGSRTVVGEQVDLGAPERLQADLVPEEDAELSTQVHSFGDKAKIVFDDTGDGYWTSTENMNKINYFETSGSVGIAGPNVDIGDVGNYATSSGFEDHCRNDHYKMEASSGFVVYGRSAGSATMKSTISNYIGQKYSSFRTYIQTVYAHDETWYKVGTTNDYRGSWLVPKLVVRDVNGDSTILNEPRDTRIEKSGDKYVGNFRASGSKNWNIQGKASWEGGWKNPYSGEFSGDINTTGPVEIKLDLPYESYADKHTDTLLHNSVIEMHWLTMTRRKFRKDAFSVEISTPNDNDTKPNNCMEISDYKDYMPVVSITTDGGCADNRVYVGSTIQIGPNDNLPPGLYISDVQVYCSEDNGDTWKRYRNFSQNVSNGVANITLLGETGSELSKEQIENGLFKFRIVYCRDQEVRIDLTPSLPRDGSGNVQIDQVYQLFNNYSKAYAFAVDDPLIFDPDEDDYRPPHKDDDLSYWWIAPPSVEDPESEIRWEYGEPASDHCFGDANIQYGYSLYSKQTDAMTQGGYMSQKMNASPHEQDINTDAMSNTATWSLPKHSENGHGNTVRNIQWINLGLNKEDLLLVNGRGYPGDATIYFTESDLSADVITIKYYHQLYKSFINAMTTDIAWMRLYLDGNGNDRIDGTYNEQSGNFVLDPNSGDEFIRSLRPGESFNELEIEPVTLEDGRKGQYFIQTCYSMTPRCLDIPKGASESDRAQVLAAITTSVDQGNHSYSTQTPEQREYNYVISGKTADEKYTSDDHPMYLEIANARTVLSIPLGGDKNPGSVKEVDGKETFVWKPHWYENNLYSYDHPEMIKIENTLAGPTNVAEGTLDDKTSQYEYKTDALRQINGYLASMRGSSTFVLVSQIQEAGTDKIRTMPDRYPVVPDSVTMSKVSSIPDASYLKKNEDSGGSTETTMPTGGEDSPMPEFKMPFDINLGGNEIGVTDYVTIILDENQVGFAISVPLLTYEKEGNTRDKWKTGEKKDPVDTNVDAVKQFHDFFTSAGNSAASHKKLNDETLGKSLEKGSDNKKHGIKSGKFTAQLSVATAFLWQYNPLDNGYYFSAWEIGVEGELGFRGQIRLTVCPAFYGYLDVKFSLELKTGLGVIRDTLHGNALIDAKTPSTAKNSVKKTYYAEGRSITREQYKILSKQEQEKYVILSNGKYGIREECLARKDFLLTQEQYDLLSDAEKANYVGPAPGEADYHNKKYGSEAEALAALGEAQAYKFPLETKAFDVRFKGKLYMEVQEKNSRGQWVKAAAGSGFVSGVLSSDGTQDTLVVIKQQDEMKLDKEVQIVLRAMDHDKNTAVDVTEITYVAPVRDIYNLVHWNGIKIAPVLDIELGVGVGVEMLKAEIFLHVSLGAEFLLWGFNPKYDPAVPKYLDKDKQYKNPAYQDEYYCRVNSFDFTIGLGFRIVLICISYELDLVSYQIHYEADGLGVGEDEKLFKDGKWSYEWHFVNDNVDSMEARDADDPDAGVTIRMPENRFLTQKVYSPEDNEPSEMSTQAYDPTDTSVPFQTSGYGSAMDAANLTTGIPEGSQYRVIRAGEKNYVVYTLSRKDAAAPEDTTMLVLSELGFNDYKYGLMNPNGSGEENYIVLDTEKNATGDLDFDAWADGSTVRAAWVSYASPAESIQSTPVRPEGNPYSAGGKTISADNYADFASDPAAKDWYQYYLELDSYNAYLQLRARNAAENTVVKTASWSPAGTTFTAPSAVIKNEDYDYVFQPSSTGSGNAVFFGSTNKADADNTAMTAYKEYIKTKDLDRKIKNYLTTMKKSTLDLLGTQSALNLALKKGDGWIVGKTALPENQTLANVDFAAARDGAYYVAYTTEQTEYLKSSGDMVTVYRLYLRRVKEKDGGVVWGNPFLIRELRDYDQDKGGTDGVYSGGSLMTGREYDSPYLSNVKFLTGNLDTDIITASGTGEPLSTQAVKEQTILTFEMDGSSYIIPESMLESIAGGKSGMIYPFFVPPMHVNEDGTEVQEGSSGKLNVDINTDDAGNLYAVYIGAVEGTTSNALYLSTYDAEVGKWGDGTMLAMHNMNTYEAAVKNDMDQKERELAYLYRSDEIRSQEEALIAMYGEEALNSVKGIKQREDKNPNRKGSSLGDGQTFTFADVQTVKGAKDGELLAVTQGSTQQMTIGSYLDNRDNRQYVLCPKYDENGLVSQQGTYVVSFGQGSADLGEGVIYFTQQDFSQGACLNVTVKAENVGTSAFRGSEDQPITARLHIDEQVLAEWTIKENVISGQALELSGTCKPLNNNLASGDTFTLTLSEFVDTSEGSTYKGISRSLDLFKVENRPDLSVENLTVTPASIQYNGSGTTLAVDFVAANQGADIAEDVYAQFTYATGRDEDGNPVYKPLSLSDSDLEVGMQETLDGLLYTQDDEDPASNGILYLYSDDGSGENSDCNIRAGCGKRVKGTIEVPAEIFCVDESRHAQIRVELFSKASSTTTSDTGVITAVHNENYDANNAAEQQVEAFTSFSAAHSIVVPLGTTTRIPITAVSARGTRPVISLKEIGGDDGQNIGILNFKQSSVNGGAVRGAISITPVSMGSGYIHVADTETNSTFSIAFTVTDALEGIDIYYDNESFAFYNKDRSRYDHNTANPATKNWGFGNEMTWGEGDAQERPMRDNLATAESGAYFEFDSMAESIDLFFKGTVTVTSTNKAFADANDGNNSVTATNTTGGSKPTSIKLGKNPENETFKITITVAEKSAVFDRLAEHYSGNVVPVPEYDGASPLLIWSRSFPDTASVTKGTIPLKLYVLDNNGIAELTVGGHQVTNPATDSAVTSMDENQLLWCYDFGKISANETISISATDVSGNVTATTLTIDWFLPSGSDPNNTVTVPPYSAGFFQNGKDLTSDTGSTEGLEIRFLTAASDYNTPKIDDNTFEVYYFDGTGFNKMTASDEDTFPVSRNGIYWARVINYGSSSERYDDTWSAQVLNLTQIENGVLQTSLSYNESSHSPALRWYAGRESNRSAVVSKVTINGCSVIDTSGFSLSGLYPIGFNGTYTLHAEDNGSPAKTADQTITVKDLKLTGPERLIETAVYTKDDKDLGTIAVDGTVLTGGYYDSEASDPAEDSYLGRFKVLLLPPDNNESPSTILSAPEEDHDWLTLEKGAYTHAWPDLPFGTYRLLFVDCGDGGIAGNSGDNTNYLVRTVVLQKYEPFRFDDVRDESKFYFTPVYWAYEANPQITNGMDDIRFAPNEGCTRGQVVTFLWRAAGCPRPENTNTGFTDVAGKAFYAKAVAWAVENGITNGTSPKTFSPDATCTRGQIVTFLWRFSNSPKPKNTETGFKDLKKGGFYVDAVAWAVENEITNGMTKTTFAPDATCTRGQVVTFLYRAMNGK